MVHMQLLHADVAADDISVNVKICLMKIELDFGWLVRVPESLVLDLNVRCLYEVDLELLCRIFALFR